MTWLGITNRRPIAPLPESRPRLQPRPLLVLLLLVLMSGLPQIGISLTGIDYGGERLQPIPLTRSLLIDKLQPQASTVVPPHLNDLPPLTIVPTPQPFAAAEWLLVGADDAAPSPWLLNLTLSLYRHQSSYV